MSEETLETLISDYVKNLNVILEITKKYDFICADKHIERVNRIANTNLVLAKRVIVEAHEEIKKYKTDIVKNNYDCFNGKKLDLFEKDISDFMSVKWKSFDESDKKIVFRMLKLMFNLGAKIIKKK